jgi:hypothetical protein
METSTQEERYTVAVARSILQGQNLEKIQLQYVKIAVFVYVYVLEVARLRCDIIIISSMANRRTILYLYLKLNLV